MSPERFKLVEEAFHAAVDLEPGARRGFVAARHADDPELCERVLALLEQHEAGGVEPGGEFLRAVRGAAEAALCEAGPATAPIPTRIASYRILRPLGEGGFGMVYLAEQDRPRRTVALKLLRTVFASGEMARRFEYEARILARLRHPGIAQIYEAGAAEVRVTDAAGGTVVMRQPFLALEYVEGPNLVEYALGDGAGRPALPVRDRLALFAQVCDALQHAHQHGVIHRDLKPDNILVACDAPAEPSDLTRPRTAEPTRLAHPKLLDFGVARVMDADPDLTRAHTAAGRMIGTLGYMSPEQIVGDSHSVDTRCDIYAMGVLLHQLLSGSLPYDVGKLPIDEAVRVVREREPAPIRALDRTVRLDAHAVVLKAMSKDRERRYASMAEFAADIRRLLSGEAVAAKGDSRWYVVSKSVKRHRVALGVATAFVLVLAASSVVGWTLYAAAQRERANAASLLRESYLNQARVWHTGNAVGRRFVATEFLKKAAELRMGDDLRSLAIASLGVSDFRSVRAFAPAEGVGSARGLGRLDRLALIREDGTIRVVSVGTGEEMRRIPPGDGPPTRVRFDESGEYLGAFYETPEGTRLVIWSLRVEAPVLVQPVRSARADFGFGAGPGGRWAAVPGDGGVLERVALPSGERRAVPGVPADATYIAASPDGSKLAMVRPMGKRLEIFDSEGGEALAAWSSDAVLRSLCWSPDSRLVGACGDDARVHLFDVERQERLPPLEGHRAAVVELSLGDELAASAGWDGTLRVWDRGKRVEAFAPMLGTDLLGFDGRRLAISREDGVQVLELSLGSPRRVLHAVGPSGSEGGIGFSRGSAVMGVAGASGVQVWDTHTWRSVTLTREDARSVFFPEVGYTAVAMVHGELRRWDLSAAFEAGDSVPPSRTVWRGGADAWASPHPDGTAAIVSEGDHVLRVDLGTGDAVRIAPSFYRMERPVVDSSGRWLFIGSWRGDAARVVDLHTGATALRLDESSVRGTFSPDGGLLTVGVPGRHLVFDTGRWDSPRTFQCREQGLSTVAGPAAVSPDGTLLAYVEPPHIVRLVNPRTGVSVATLPNAERYVIPELRFSPDGGLLVVLTLDEAVIVWDMDKLREGLKEVGMGW